MDDRIREALRAGAELGSRYSVAIPREAGTGGAGSRSGVRPGRSMDFRDYRAYTSGDDLRWIDWNVFARTDKLTVKLFHEEVQPHVDIIVDNSRSMALEGTPKLEATAGLAAALAVATENAGLQSSVWVCRGAMEPIPGEQAHPATWEGLDFDCRISLPEALRLRPPPFKRRGVRVIVSDLMWPDDPQSFLARVGDGAAALHVVQLLSKADAAPEKNGYIQVVDSESGREIDVLYDESARRSYSDAFALHSQSWLEACRKSGATLSALRAEDLVSSRDLDALVAVGVLEAA